MNATFRLVHFVADPFTGARFPVGALVRTRDRIQVARTPEPIDLGLARTSGAAATARLVADALAEARNFDELPAAAGPQAELGEEREIPPEVASPVDWVRDCVLLRATPLRQRAPAATSKERRAAGYRFLKQYGIAQFVGQRLHARELVPGLKAASVLTDISQYVRGPNRLLLIEPVLIVHAHQPKTIRRIGTTFMAWQHALERTEFAHRTEYYAYVLDREGTNRAGEVRELLSGSDVKVLDVNRTDERTHFIDVVRSAAQVENAV